MSALEDRVRTAVKDATTKHAGVTHLALRDAFVAFLGVLEESFDLPTPDPADEAPPVHQVPTVPGAVVLATEVRGARFERPLLVARIGGGPTDVPWTASEDVLGFWWHGDEHITDWFPARVVPDDAHGPVATLRRILDVATKVDGIPCDEARDLITVEASEALAALGDEAVSRA